jgi:hypothetical protein
VKLFATTRTMEREAHLATLIQVKTDAERRATYATKLLNELVSALEQTKVNQTLNINALDRMANRNTGEVIVRSPHDQDPRLWDARRKALRFLGREW